MIKDKISPELKKRFKEEIKRSIFTGKEQGFLLCKDNKDTLNTSKSSIEGEGELNFSKIKYECPIKIQGDFHTHVHMPDIKSRLKEGFPKENFPEGVIRNITIQLYNRKNISVTEPSHGDLLGVLVLKNKNMIVGTTCSSSDTEPDIVECWTVKENINKKHYDRADKEITDSRLVRNSPREWIRPLFDKEIIDLRK
jgi:hypothetical protein